MLVRRDQEFARDEPLYLVPCTIEDLGKDSGRDSIRKTRQESPGARESDGRETNGFGLGRRVRIYSGSVPPVLTLVLGLQSHSSTIFAVKLEFTTKIYTI